MGLFGDQLFTPRLRLRKIGEQDLNLILAWSRSSEAHGPYLSPENLREDRLRSQLASGALWNSQERLFLIVRREDDKPLGTIHYWRPAGRDRVAALALKITEAGERGQGYGTEAQKYLIRHLFEQEGMERVEMHTDINNQAQQRCLAKLGFELVESLTYTDQQVERIGHLYRLTRSAYLSQPLYQYHEL